jgi:hypothetical protein
MKTFVVNLEDKTQLLIKQASWKNLEDIELLQLEILKAAYEASFSLGTLFRSSNKQFWDNAKKVAALLPVVGQEELGFDPEQIEDLDELCRIFVTTSTRKIPETGSITSDSDSEIFQPSEICRIHDLNFLNLLIQIEEAAKNQKQEKVAAKARKS